MDRGRVLSAVALVLAVVALGTVAGGLSTGETGPSETGPGVGIGAGEGSGVGNGSGIGFNMSGGSELGFPPWLGVGALLAIVWGSVILAGGYALVVLWRANLREILNALARVAGRVAAVTVVIGVLVVIMYALSTLFQQGGGGLLGSSADSALDLPGTVESPSSNLVTGVVLLAGGALVVLVLVTMISSRDGGGGTIPGVRKRSEREREELGITRVRADGAVDDPTASNDVYRAWRDLRDAVGGRERRDTPEELRRRALAAGYDERAVGELTALFNAVRYGDDGPTAERERRARELGASLTDGDGSGDR